MQARFIEPMLAQAVKELPTGPGWSYELKLDGYRTLGLKSAAAVRLYSRNGKDFWSRFPSVTRALDALPDETLIDGEVVAVDEHGRPSFSSLQNFDRAPVFYAFDLPMLAGEDLTHRPMDDRRKALRKLTRRYLQFAGASLLAFWLGRLVGVSWQDQQTDETMEARLGMIQKLGIALFVALVAAALVTELYLTWTTGAPAFAMQSILGVAVLTYPLSKGKAKIILGAVDAALVIVSLVFYLLVVQAGFLQ